MGTSSLICFKFTVVFIVITIVNHANVPIARFPVHVAEYVKTRVNTSCAVD